MTRRISRSQLNNMIRRAETERRRAIQRFNQDVRKYNQEARRQNQKQRDAINKFNRDVNEYNRLVRQHNERVRAHRQRLRNELSRLTSRASSTRYVTLQASTKAVHNAYVRYEAQAESDAAHAEFLDLAEREDANNIEVLNALLDDEGQSPASAGDLQATRIVGELRSISTDLDSRWHGALYSLSPNNPDACRHLCSSAREIFAQVLHIKAPNDLVLTTLPDCEKTDKGHPTRRSRIVYLLHKKGLGLNSLEDFVEPKSTTSCSSSTRSTLVRMGQRGS